jgi:hypothetical protein
MAQAGNGSAKDTRGGTCHDGGRSETHRVNLSPRNQTLTRVCRTPRAAEETMWETGEVTLTLRRPAKPIKKPKTPCSCEHHGQGFFSACLSQHRLTVANVPHNSLPSGSCPVANIHKSGPSPKSRASGTIRQPENMFE